MGKLIVVGDIHLQNSLPKKYQAIDFLEWLSCQEFNNENNDLLLLGDLCEVNSTFELFGVYVDYFENKFNFNRIVILQGNHDCVNQSTILSIFKPLNNVEIITDFEIYNFGKDLKCAMLPHYNHEGTDRISMIERYGNLYKDLNDVEFDYGFGHIEDDTEHFSKKFCDTSKLKVKTWMNGHIHTSNIQNGGHYLGSPILNSSTESGKIPYIASIDLDTKEYELIEVPKFMEYYEVTYPNKIPKIDTKYGLFLVKDSIDKNTTTEEYSKQAKEMGFDFYARRILSKKAIENIDDSSYNEERDSLESMFNAFSKRNELSNEISDICLNVIRLKEGKNA